MAETWQTLLFETCERGVSSAVAPELLGDTQYSWGSNIDIRGGKPATRPNIELRLDLPNGLIQGGEYFGIQNGMLVLSIAGHLHRIRVNNRTFSSEEIGLSFVNSGVIKQVWMCQTVETLVIQDGQSNAILYNGSTAVRATGNQVPRGRQMAYGNGRLWQAINAKELVAGDIRTRNPGSELKFTETNYLTGGGSLYFPRGMTGLAFIPVTGQADYGALLAFGLDYTNAIRADVTSRDQWQSIPGFEQAILRSVGAGSQWSIVAVNQDLYWKDSNAQIRSIRNALADEQGPGSSPISREVSRLTDYDSQQLMPWCSGVYFENRLLMTSSPFLLSNGGIGWKNLISLDFAPLSTMQGKSQASYNGQWSGLNFVKLIGGDFSGKSRSFVITTSDDGRNQLWEFNTGNRADMSGICDSDFAITPSPITSFIEYPRRNFGLASNRKRLERCDVWLSAVDGPLDVAVYWRADNAQKWLKWDEDTACANTTDPASTTPHVWKNLLPQERPQFKTFTIPDGINRITGYASEVGFEFQIRLVWTGRCRIHRVMTLATVLDEPNFAMREEFVAECLDNDVSGNEIEYAIPTEGCAAIGVTQADTSIPDGGAFDYGVSVGDLEKTFVIHNTGEGVLVIGEVAVTDGTGATSDFEMVTQPAPEIPVGGSSSFIVRMIGTPSGAKFCVVNIPTNITAHNPFNFNLTGFVAINADIPFIYRSKGGPSGVGASYTICGFDEFVDPSTPPRKYLNLTNTGFYRSRQWNTADCTGSPISDVNVAFSGVCFYTPDCSGCGVPDGSSIVNGTCGITNVPEGTHQVNTKTSSQLFVNTIGCEMLSSSSREFETDWKNELSNEDTEASAINRNNGCIGFDSDPVGVAKIFPRVSGFMASYVSVDAKFQFTGLPAGQNYIYRVTYGRRVYGTSGPFLIFAVENIPYVTAGGVEQTPFIDLPNESGFETNVLSVGTFPA